MSLDFSDLSESLSQLRAIAVGFRVRAMADAQPHASRLVLWPAAFISPCYRIMRSIVWSSEREPDGFRSGRCMCGGWVRFRVDGWDVAISDATCPVFRLRQLDAQKRMPSARMVRR